MFFKIILADMKILRKKSFFLSQKNTWMNFFNNVLENLTTICENVRDRICLSVCPFESYLLPDHLRYGYMNGTMLSQIVRGMF